MQDFDEKGLFYWLGTNGLTEKEWLNPGLSGVVRCSSSDGSSQPYGRPHDILSRAAHPLNCHTNDDKSAPRTWLELDLY